MIGVYIIDDEQLIVDELRALINWGDYGFEVLGYSSSPSVAEKEIIELKPHVVFSDVSMDEMNGFALFEHVKQVHKKIKFCFLSAFDTFEFAQEAIRLGAIRYLKKPINIHELINLLVEIKNNEQENFNRLVFDSIVNHVYLENDVVLENLFKENPTLPKNENMRIVVFSKTKDNIDFIEPTAKYSEIVYQDEKMIIYICVDVDIDRISFLVDENNISIGISEEFFDYKRISFNLRVARIASKEKFFTNKNECTIYSYNENINTLIQEIDRSKNAYELLAEIQTLHSRIETYQIKVYDFQKIYKVIVFNMTKFGVVDYNDNLADISVLDYYSSFEEMISDIVSHFKKDEEEEGTSNIISEVIKELEDHIEEKLTLSYFANKYNYNSSYFSQLFKKVCGCSFAEYFINLKMERAKKLIANTDLSLTTIASSIGYDDYYHFSKMFKKYSDYSPSKYRELFKS